MLSLWECEFYKALHLLRDGTPLPRRHVPPTGLTKTEIRIFIEHLKRISPEEYWLTSKRVAVEFGERLHLGKPPRETDLWWAEQERNQEILSLGRMLNPPPLQAQLKRRKIWIDLVRAKTFSSLRKACGRWARLPDIRARGLTPFCRHVLDNPGQFLAMKHNKRFPRSSYGDDARVEYLARGMAGIMCGLSPMTGIERLRNMKHQRGGQLWVAQQGESMLAEREQYCGCWRCSIERSSKLSEMGWKSYENGLRLFLQLARTTKVPTAWRTVKSKGYVKQVLK